MHPNATYQQNCGLTVTMLFTKLGFSFYFHLSNTNISIIYKLDGVH